MWIILVFLGILTVFAFVAARGETRKQQRRQGAQRALQEWQVWGGPFPSEHKD